MRIGNIVKIKDATSPYNGMLAEVTASSDSALWVQVYIASLMIVAWFPRADLKVIND